MSDNAKKKSLEALTALHDEVDRGSRALADRHRERLRCGRGCADCCVDDLTVFEAEADLIRGHHAELLDSGHPHAPGACAFLDGDGACRIYAQRPYVCRTQGLPLRWLEAGEDGAASEMRDICPLNDETGPPVETLPAVDCWTLGPYEARLRDIQARHRDGTTARVRLRSLFRRR